MVIEEYSTFYRLQRRLRYIPYSLNRYFKDENFAVDPNLLKRILYGKLLADTRKLSGNLYYRSLSDSLIVFYSTINIVI